MRQTLRPLAALLLAAAALAACAAPGPAAVRAFQTPTPTPPPIPTLAAATPAEPAAVPTGAPRPTDAPTPTPAPQPWTFAVLGDTRTAGLDPPGVTGTIVGIAAQRRPRVTLAVGDLINAMDDQDSVREQWRRWRAAVAPLDPGGQQPWLLVTPGNHDVQGHAWATGLMAEAFPELPADGPPGLERLAYRVDVGGVRFISVHSEIFGDPHHLGDAQLAWLESQLRDNPNRYTVVFSHDPAFPVGPHVGSSLDAYPAERDRLWDLLRQYRVSAYVAGHEHLYSRQDHGGVTQLIVGTSGSSPYGGFGGDYYHTLLAEVRPDGLACTVLDSSGAVRDTFTIPPSAAPGT